MQNKPLFFWRRPSLPVCFCVFFPYSEDIFLHCDHLPDAVFRCAALCITCLFNSGCVLCPVYTMNLIVYPIYTETLSNKLYSAVQLQEAKTKFNPILMKILKLLFWSILSKYAVHGGKYNSSQYLRPSVKIISAHGPLISYFCTNDPRRGGSICLSLQCYVICVKVYNTNT